MDNERKVVRDDENLGAAVLIIFISFAIFVAILPLSPTGAMLTIFSILGLYMLKTIVTGRF